MRPVGQTVALNAEEVESGGYVAPYYWEGLAQKIGYGLKLQSTMPTP